MKKLTRMKLINWHRFTNCMIEFGSSTLISGENGAGKSTLLDAIQFVIGCSANSFNKAAHENGKRKLTGYIRCKTGKENKPYERTGELSAHVALEFYEESRERYFIIGAVVDSASEGQETVVRYLIDDKQMAEEMFLDGNRIRSIAEFRAAHADGIAQWCNTQKDARKMVLARFGRIENKFFSLIPKALAFRPINDIKDFVYSYVLDAKEVNIDILRENVRTYQDLERTLDSVKQRMRELEQIEKCHDRVMERLQKDRMYEYLLQQVKLDITKEMVQKTEGDIRWEENRLKEIEEKLRQLSGERDQKQEMETSLRVELKQSSDFLALEEQKKERERLKSEEERYLDEKRDLTRSIRRASDMAVRLLGASYGEPCIQRYSEQLRDVDSIADLADLKQLTEQVIQYKNTMYGKRQRQIAELQVNLNKEKQERGELSEKIKRLEKKKLTYPEGVERVMTAIKEAFAEIGRRSEPYVLCELLEITDAQWRDAVEGYLNTQRFYILVEPDSFDIALGIYDRLRKEGKAYGVGLINTQRMEEYEDAMPGTLAMAVTSKNKYARRYIHMILGKVHLCERYEDLKKYPISITKECMRYQNRVASAIRPEVFGVPFIGNHALKVQLEQAKKQKNILDESISGMEKRLSGLNNAFALLGTEADVDIKYRLDVLSELRAVRKRIEKCQENIRTLEENSTLIQKQIQLEALKKQVDQIQDEIGRTNQRKGQTEQKIAGHKKDLERLMLEQAQEQGTAAVLAAGAQDALVSWMEEYEAQVGQKPYEQLRDSFERRRKTNETLCKNEETRMADAMIRYKTDHDFGAAPNMEGYPEFAAVYERLRTSELLEYEERVQSARAAAEDEFREQFLAKLQENMKQAQAEFRNLNKALRDITFSNERYEFLFMPSGTYRSYYEMIMDDFNIVQGESIFSGVFHEAHKEVIDELFERLALNNENSAKTLEEFTDYRTYMDYDIKIIHTDGSYAYYSKVCEEKSGGETQTPFYVTVAASFVQLYGNNIGSEAAGLVMFDEAFNNMDDERIGGVLEFLNRLPLQLIIAAPPDKIQYIGPAMEETLLVMTDEKVSFVEEYYNAV